MSCKVIVEIPTSAACDKDIAACVGRTMICSKVISGQEAEPWQTGSSNRKLINLLATGSFQYGCGSKMRTENGLPW